MNKQITQSNIAQTGQALITLVFIMVIGITIISAATLVLSTNVASTSTAEQGMMAYYAAESGAENGLLRLVRNPSYTGESITVGNAAVTIQANGAGGCPASTICSTANLNNSIRKIQIQINNAGGAFTVAGWKEVQ